ncbi:MAG: GTP-binding protein, partial [Geminicoccaceae bacterium]
MRLISLVAPTSQQAVADLRAELGHDAVVVTTQTTDDGQVRITGALAEDDIDLADVLSPQSTQDGSGWLTELGEFHGWPETWRETVRWLAEDGPAVEPNASLASLLRTHCAFQKPAYTTVRPILFSGPPGSGKTATIAKIAASCVLDGRSVDVLTLD